MKIESTPMVIHYKCLRCGDNDRKTKPGIHKGVHGWYCEDTFMCEWDAWGMTDAQMVQRNTEPELHQKAIEIRKRGEHYPSDAFNFQNGESVFDWYQRTQELYRKSMPHLKLGGDND
jgi:hypothetical protein